MLSQKRSRSVHHRITESQEYNYSLVVVQDDGKFHSNEIHLTSLIISFATELAEDEETVRGDITI